MTASQKRGALLLLVVLVCILGWRWRLAYLAENAPLPEQDEVAEGPAEKAEEQETQPKREWNSNDRDGGDENRPAVLVDLNSADTTELQKVRGIGPVLSKRIVKYRKLIGGFTDKSQLRQVYGLSPENYEQIAGQVYADTTGAAFFALSVHEAPPRPPDPAEFHVPAPEEDDISRSEPFRRIFERILSSSDSVRPSL